MCQICYQVESRWMFCCLNYPANPQPFLDRHQSFHFPTANSTELPCSTDQDSCWGCWGVKNKSKTKKAVGLYIDCTFCLIIFESTTYHFNWRRKTSLQCNSKTYHFIGSTANCTHLLRRVFLLVISFPFSGALASFEMLAWTLMLFSQPYQF